MNIRQENEHDYGAVYTLITEAFKEAEHSDGNEQNLVVALRKSPAFIPELSLVAEIDNKIVGHILFTEVKVNEQTALALAPLSVSPTFQKQGIGQALMAEGHRKAKELGYSFSIVLGSELYYPKAGYLPAENFGIKAPFEVPSANFMAINLTNEQAKLEGTVQYAKEFGIE